MSHNDDKHREFCELYGAVRLQDTALNNLARPSPTLHAQAIGRCTRELPFVNVGTVGHIDHPKPEPFGKGWDAFMPFADMGTVTGRISMHQPNMIDNIRKTNPMPRRSATDLVNDIKQAREAMLATNFHELEAKTIVLVTHDREFAAKLEAHIEEKGAGFLGYSAKVLIVDDIECLGDSRDSSVKGFNQIFWPTITLQPTPLFADFDWVLPNSDPAKFHKQKRPKGFRKDRWSK